MINRKGHKTDITVVMKNRKKQDSLIIEIKQSISDFYSGCGLNFIGLSNYIAVSSDLEGFAISLNDKTESYAERWIKWANENPDKATGLI